MPKETATWRDGPQPQTGSVDYEPPRPWMPPTGLTNPTTDQINAQALARRIARERAERER